MACYSYFMEIDRVTHFLLFQMNLLLVLKLKQLKSIIPG